MNRRELLKTVAAGATATCVGVRPRESAAVNLDLPDDVRITRVVGFRLAAERPKLVGKNAYLDVHGRTGGDFVWQIETNAGVTGFGAAPDNRDSAAKIVGKNPAEFYRAADRAVEGPFGRGDMPIWDLVAKLAKKPAHELFGGKGPERVPVYDGSIYFADLLPEFESRGVDRIVEEIDQGIERGHRAFKLKIGRGWKWMKRDDGDRRDIEVLRAVRKHVGPDITLFVDANNGYDLAGTKRFLEAVGDLNLAFIEEMFPEVVEQDLDLKAFIRDHDWKTLVADGESAREPSHFEPFVAARAFDIVQPDIKAFGFTLQLKMDRMLAGTGVRLAPHNWGSLVGFYMQLHLGRGIDTFYRAEHDPLATDLLVADGYSIRDGHVRVPDAPGFGLALRPGAIGDTVKPAWEIRT